MKQSTGQASKEEEHFGPQLRSSSSDARPHLALETEVVLEHEPPRHEKIRFRRDEIADLAALPSAVGPDPTEAGSRRWRRGGGIALGIVGVAVALPLLVIAVIVAMAQLGIGSERLRLEAERAFQAFARPGMDAFAGPARLVFDPTRLLALEVRDLGVQRAPGEKLLDAEFVRFGIRLLPLLSGDVRLSSAELSNARIVADQGGDADWTVGMRNAEGLLDPDLVTKAVFRVVHSTLDAMDLGSTEHVTLENVEIVLPPRGGLESLRLIGATLSGREAGRLRLEAEVESDGRIVTIDATAGRDARRRITNLHFAANAAAPAATHDAGRPILPGHRLGAFQFDLSGAEGDVQSTSRLVADLSLRGSALDLGRRGMLEGDVDFQGTLVGGTNKLEVDRLDVAVGRSRFGFHGAVGPRPPTGGEVERPAYRFDLISPKSTIAPETSQEPALHTYVRLTGDYLAGEQTLNADEIVVNSGNGEALGKVSVRFVEGMAPGIAAEFSVAGMPAAEVKSLWPWFSASGARNWVMENVFGGSVPEGRLSFNVEPGRMGNGVPMSPEEVSGFFVIDRTRFDTAGLIPPVRDAVGSVDFRGNDVEITLSSGTVFLPSGRTVAASNGRMMITDANVRPVVGVLDIDVAGDAPAVAELASYDPINAMRRVGLSADDFSGEVAGHVKAEIPLHKGIDARELEWLVALDYQNLSIAKPVDGQRVTEAVGSITVEPRQAVLKAKAKLNGVVAEIEAVEPLGRNDAGRQRLVQLLLDDEARETIAPGISELVKGTVAVSLDISDGSRRVKADLTDAELWLPWAGWTKGPGIPADVSFVMDRSGDASRLSDFRLSGKSFNVEGSMTLSEGSIASARFTKVKLNRGDDVAVSVTRTGKGFSVDVSGASLDARSVVKLFISDTGTNRGKRRGKGSSVAITADVKTMTGFHGERLSNVRLDYRGSPGRVEGLDVTAATASGQAVEIRNGLEGRGRSMRMRSADAGTLLRFLDLYEHMEGGTIDVSLKGGANGPMSGRVDARDFWVVGEPRLGSLVSSRPPGDQMSLNEAVKRDIDASRVRFERGFTEIDKGDGYLNISNGVLRGPLLGFIFQGTLYDGQGNMNMTGTFMPAYGINRIFGEIPLLGMFLGNGRDRGLIGVTFRLAGDAKKPELSINPLSIIAPGIFRSIFEYR